jgi:hypothetical protein
MNTQINKRIVSLDYLKFLGPLLITNSHFDSIYSMPIFATGGAIGDAIFFFISGYTLNYSSNLTSFSKWYKRRLFRIFPTVFAVAIIHELIFGIDRSLISIILNAGGWFVRCILLYYIMFFIIKKYIPNKTKLLTFSILVISLLYIVFSSSIEQTGIYGGTYFKWFHFLLPFLLGMITFQNKIILKRNIIFPITLGISLVLFYLVQYLTLINILNIKISSVVSLIMLQFLILSLYYTVEISLKKYSFLKSKKFNFVVYFIGGLALQIYLIQDPIVNTGYSENTLINILLNIIFILIGAYFTKVLANIISEKTITKSSFFVTPKSK